MVPPPSLPSNRTPAVLIAYGLIVLLLLADVISLPIALISME